MVRPISGKGLYYNEAQKRWNVLSRPPGRDVLWSRIAAQNWLSNGEELPDGCIVHHKNGDNTDDRPENL